MSGRFGRMALDAWIRPGMTHKAAASQLRRSAEADRRGSGKKPKPGMRHGEPDEFSIRSAMRQEKMADWHDQQAASGKKLVTEEDLQTVRNLFPNG